MSNHINSVLSFLTSYLVVTSVDGVMVAEDCCKSDTNGNCSVTAHDDVEVATPALTMQYNQIHS